MKYSGTLYKSRWDWFTWSMVGIMIAITIFTLFTDDGIVPSVICAFMTAFILVTLKGIYYSIDGDILILYQFFRPTALPIDKISEVSRSNSCISAPATAITRRLAIKFSDRSVLKSSMPILISPENENEFIGQLLAVNPKILVKV